LASLHRPIMTKPLTAGQKLGLLSVGFSPSLCLITESASSSVSGKWSLTHCCSFVTKGESEEKNHH
jgi:hypothetical protein